MSKTPQDKRLAPVTPLVGPRETRPRLTLEKFDNAALAAALEHVTKLKAPLGFDLISTVQYHSTTWWEQGRTPEETVSLAIALPAKLQLPLNASVSFEFIKNYLRERPPTAQQIERFVRRLRKTPGDLVPEPYVRLVALNYTNSLLLHEITSLPEPQWRRELIRMRATGERAGLLGDSTASTKTKATAGSSNQAKKP